MFPHNVLPASVLREVKGVVRRKIWKRGLEVEKGGACETGIRWLFQRGGGWAEGGGGEEGARKVLLLLRRHLI